ncbi:hypothetical protein V8C35DRAFT_318855 [Trichoderma chlorosporum]
MQAGLATDELISNNAFQASGHGLAMFSITAPLISAVAILLFVSVCVVSNWRATASIERRTFEEIEVRPYWRDMS